jgi:hypothetical protein
MMPTVIFGSFFTDPIILVLRPFFKVFFEAVETESNGESPNFFAER